MGVSTVWWVCLGCDGRVYCVVGGSRMNGWAMGPKGAQKNAVPNPGVYCVVGVSRMWRACLLWVGVSTVWWVCLGCDGRVFCVVGVYMMWWATLGLTTVWWVCLGCDGRVKIRTMSGFSGRWVSPGFPRVPVKLSSFPPPPPANKILYSLVVGQLVPPSRPRFDSW